MKIRSAELKTVCGFTSVLPEPQLPEIAFAGRSNVGKSSLINALMQRKRLARVGETPGKTRTINFYEVEALVPHVKEGDPAGGLQSERAADNPEEKTAGNPEGKTADRVEVPARFSCCSISATSRMRMTGRCMTGSCRAATHPF